jgi:hypothetical protein
VNCPSCGNRFQTPVEQILDVRVDPSVRNRLISGSVNVAVCPSCGTGGALNIPFIYHDPEEEVALLYLPVDAGPNEVERQKAAGRLTRQLMDAMPPEERKGYLLQPETFISMETLIKRVLELEGVTEEDMERSQRQREFVGELLQAEADDWPEMLEENEAFVNEGLFAFLEYVMQLSAAQGAQGVQTADAEKLENLHTYLVEETEIGKTLARRTEIMRSFVENPSRDALLDALREAPDEETITMLIQSGAELLDYGFFQKLVKRIDEAESDEDEDAWREIRRTVMKLRDEMVEASESAAQERALLLGKLLASEDPKRMASSHLSELDDLFFAVMSAEMQRAQQEGDQKGVQELQQLAAVINEVMEGTMPPEIALTRRLLVAVTENKLDQQLKANRQLLTPQYLQFLASLEESMQEQGQDEAASRIAEIRSKASAYAGSAPAGQAEKAPAQSQIVQPQQPAGQGKPAQKQEPGSDSEERTPSGLIIAKR